MVNCAPRRALLLSFLVTKFCIEMLRPCHTLTFTDVLADAQEARAPASRRLVVVPGIVLIAGAKWRLTLPEGLADGSSPRAMCSPIALLPTAK